VIRCSPEHRGPLAEPRPSSGTFADFLFVRHSRPTGTPTHKVGVFVFGRAERIKHRVHREHREEQRGSDTDAERVFDRMNRMDMIQRKMQTIIRHPSSVIRHQSSIINHESALNPIPSIL
jgi:hypothetical protein